MTSYKPFLYVVPLLFLLACSGAVEDTDGSSQQNPTQRRIVTSKHLFGVEARGKSHVWVVGFEGTIFHSSDAGETWKAQKAPSNTDLYDACFVDTKTGWIVGKFGTIFHTTNGGETWVAQTSGTKERLFDSHFVDHQTGWAVGVMGTILHTKDGGKNWESQGFGEDRYYNSVSFIDNKRGWIAGEYSVIYHTDDGGKTWTPQECEDIIPEEPEDDFPAPPPHLFSVYFSDSSTGWISGMDGIILKTDDGGKNWRQLETGTIRTLFMTTVVGNRGLSIGERGLYFESSDGGINWKRDKDAVKTRFWLRALKLTDQQYGWIVGAFGTIIRTTDGGNSWEMLSGISIQ